MLPGCRHSRHPEWIAAMPPDRLRTPTRANPADRIMPARTSWSGKFPDALGQIAITRRVSRDAPPQNRQRPKRPRIVKRLQHGDLNAARTPGRRTARPASARAAPPPARPACRCSCADRTRSRRDPPRDPATAVARHRQPPAKPRRSGRLPTARSCATRQHRRVDVGQQHRAAAPCKPGEPDIAGARRQGPAEHAPGRGSSNVTKTRFHAR